VDHIDIAAQLTRIDCEGPSEVDGTEDGMLWIDSEVDGDARSECKEDEETYCEDGDSDTDW